jgi:hypothetical protein
MHKDYTRSDLFAAENIYVRIYETLKAWINALPGTAKNLHEKALLAGFPERMKTLLIFATDLRNDLIHNDGLVRKSTIESADNLDSHYSKILIDRLIVNHPVEPNPEIFIETSNYFFEEIANRFEVAAQLISQSISEII